VYAQRVDPLLGVVGLHGLGPAGHAHLGVHRDQAAVADHQQQVRAGGAAASHVGLHGEVQTLA
jgi:hypothetical protein